MNNQVVAEAGLRRMCLVAHDPGVQGAERALLDMAMFLRDAGWDVTVVLPSETGGLAVLLDDAGLERVVIRYYYWMGDGRLLGRLKRLTFNVIALARLVAFFRRERFNCIYTHSTAVGAPPIAARLARRAHVWHMHEFGPFEAGDRVLVYDLGERITLALMRWSDSGYVAVANVIRETFKPKLGNADVRVIYQPVPFSSELVAEDSEAVKTIASLSGPKIIYVGAITATKRQEDAVRAMPTILSKHPTARLIFGGRIEPAYGAQIDALAQELGIAESIVKLGYLTNAPAIIGLCDVSINCRLAEASPRVLVESMMAGTAVVAAGAGGNVETIAHGAGLLYEPCDSADLAAKINWIIENPKEAEQMVVDAKKRAILDRDVTGYKDRYVSLIEDAINVACGNRQSGEGSPK